MQAQDQSETLHKMETHQNQITLPELFAWKLQAKISQRSTGSRPLHSEADRFPLQEMPWKLQRTVNDLPGEHFPQNSAGKMVSLTVSQLCLMHLQLIHFN